MQCKVHVIGGHVGLNFIYVFNSCRVGQNLDDPRGAFIMKGVTGICIVLVAELTRRSESPTWRRGCGYADICKPEV